MRKIILVMLLLTILPLTMSAGDNFIIHASDGSTSINGTDICVDIFGTPTCFSDIIAGAGINTIVAGSGLFGGGSGSSVTVNVSADTCGGTDVSSYNGTGFDCVAQTGSGGAGKEGDGTYLYNDSTTMFFNETHAGENLAVNSSDNWDGLDTINSTWFENIVGVLSLKLSELTSFFDTLFSGKTTDDLSEGSTNLYDNQSWNESHANTLYADISVTGDNQSWNESYADTLYVNIDGDTMTGDLNFSGSGIYNASFISLNTTQSDPAHLEGLIFYDQELLVPSFYTEDSGVKNSLGLEIWKRVRNTGGVQINDGDAVYIKGSTGQVAEVGLAVANNIITARVIGLATVDIVNNEFGWVTVLGDVHNLNTSAFIPGDLIYLSDTTAGAWTNTAPSSPSFAISLGEIINSHVNQGIISVSPSPTDVLNHMVIQDLTINNNFTVIGNISTDGFYFGDGSQLSGISGDNQSWNESYANTLYSTIDEPLWTANSSTIARAGDCPVGEFVVNTTTGGVECEAPAGVGTVTNIATDDVYLTGGPITSTGTITFNETRLNNTGDIRYVNVGEDINATLVKIALGIGSPTIDQLQEYLDNTGSSGFFDGGELSDGGSGTLDVAAGSGFIRTTNNDNAQLQSFKWSASSAIPVPDDTTQYVYINYTGDISLSQNEFLETPDKIKIGVVTDEAGVIVQTFALGVRLQESIGEAGRFIRQVHGISRDTRQGGLIMGQSGDANRDVTMTSGALWWGRTEYVIDSFDTSGADTFDTYSASGKESSSASQFPNTQYDNAGTLTTINNNRWANLFFFLEPDNHIIMIYGRDEFLSEALAENEGVPSTSLPSRVSETSILISRFTFQESSNTATISSAFDALFANAGVTDHGNLAGLADDDHTQYVLEDGSRELTANWNQGAFNLTNTLSWFLGKVDWSTIQNIPFSISDYFTKSDILGFNYYNATDFSIADYFTSSQILGFGYYNLTDFNIADYSTTAQADLLYADISVTGDNSSWNESYANTLYSTIDEPLWTANSTNVAFTNIEETFENNLIIQENVTFKNMTYHFNGSHNIFDS